MHPGRTARKHLCALAASSGVPAARAGQVLAEVGLDSAADQRVGGFSLGMRQRLALAGALLADPEVQHGTLPGVLAAHPARWVVAAAKTIAAAAMGVLLGMAGNRLLALESDIDSSASIAVALIRWENALVFGGYTITAVALGAALLSVRDPD